MLAYAKQWFDTSSDYLGTVEDLSNDTDFVEIMDHLDKIVEINRKFNVLFLEEYKRGVLKIILEVDQAVITTLFFYKWDNNIISHITFGYHGEDQYSSEPVFIKNKSRMYELIDSPFFIPMSMLSKTPFINLFGVFLNDTPPAK